MTQQTDNAEYHVSHCSQQGQQKQHKKNIAELFPCLGFHFRFFMITTIAAINVTVKQRMAKTPYALIVTIEEVRSTVPVNSMTANSAKATVPLNSINASRFFLYGFLAFSAQSATVVLPL